MNRYAVIATLDVPADSRELVVEAAECALTDYYAVALEGESASIFRRPTVELVCFLDAPSVEHAVDVVNEVIFERLGHVAQRFDVQPRARLTTALTGQLV